MNPRRIPEVDFDAAYQQSPPWEVGRPQPVIADLAARGDISSPVLDVGCGTGENALELARHGLEVVGVDAALAAIEAATFKGAERSLEVEFRVVDAYQLATLGRRFATVIDSALLHVIHDRARYVQALSSVLASDGRVILLEISDEAEIPYPKISEAEIRESFPEPWRIESLTRASYETKLGTFPAWVALVATS